MDSLHDLIMLWRGWETTEKWEQCFLVTHTESGSTVEAAFDKGFYYITVKLKGENPAKLETKIKGYKKAYRYIKMKCRFLNGAVR